MSIDWQPATTPATGMSFNPSDTSFTNLLFNFLIPLEASTESERLNLTPVTNPKGQSDLTIGIGFDLRAGSSTVQNAVFEQLGLVPSVVELATANQPLNPSDANYTEEQIEYGYVTRLMADIDEGSQSAIEDMNAIMQERWKELGSNEAYGGFVAAAVNSNTEPGVVQHSAFAFSGDTEVYAVFKKLWPLYYEGKIFAIFPSLQGTSFVNSREEMALADLIWNGGPGLIGDQLQNAINSGNRAEAWFQIRDWSNASDNSVAAQRRYYDAQVFGLFDNPSQPTEQEALQAYQMLSQNRAAIVDYEVQFGSDPYSSSALTPSGAIAAGNTRYGLDGTSGEIQTLAQAFDPAADQEISYLDGLYGGVLPAIQADDTATGGSSGFDVRSVDIYAASSADLSVDARVSDAPAAEAAADESANHILLGNESGDTLTGGLGSDILVAGVGDETLNAGQGSDTLIGGTGSDVLNGGPGSDVFDLDFTQNPDPGSVVETIVDGTGNGTLDVNGLPIGTGTLTPTGTLTWSDGAYQYQFIPGAQIPAADLEGTGVSTAVWGPDVGELQITPTGTNAASTGTIDVLGFDLNQAATIAGFLGIHLPETLQLCR